MRLLRAVDSLAQAVCSVLHAVHRHAHDLDEEGEGVQHAAHDPVSADLGPGPERPEVEEGEGDDPEEVEDHDDDDDLVAEDAEPVGQVRHVEAQVDVLADHPCRQMAPELLLLR